MHINLQILWYWAEFLCSIDMMKVYILLSVAVCIFFAKTYSISKFLKVSSKNSHSFFIFYFKQLYFFHLWMPLWRHDIDPAIHKRKMKVARNEKTKTTKYIWVFFFFKYSKFSSISLEFKLEHKSFILEMWVLTPLKSSIQVLWYICNYKQHCLYEGKCICFKIMEW